MATERIKTSPLPLYRSFGSIGTWFYSITGKSHFEAIQNALQAIDDMQHGR